MWLFTEKVNNPMGLQTKVPPADRWKWKVLIMAVQSV